MKRKKSRIGWLCLVPLFLVGCGAPGGSGATPAPTAEPTPAATQTPAPTAVPTAVPMPGDVPQPQTAEEAYAGVRLAQHVTPAMLQADYWAKPGDDAMFMTPEQVQGFNLAVMQTLVPEERMFDLSAWGESIPGNQVRGWMEADPCLKGGEYINGTPMPAGYLTALRANKAMDALPEQVRLRFGVTVDRCDVRLQPTADFAGGAGERFIDALQQADMYWNEPLLILHESADDDWYYILSERMTGWLPKEQVALFDDRESWLAWQQPADFLVVTADRFRLDVDTVEPSLSDRELVMGTILPLADMTTLPQKVAGRIPYGNYIARLPLRGEDGRLRIGYAPVPVSDKVHRGYLPCTRRQVLNQMFRLQGRNYGWGGTQHSNDCSGITQEIYRCFGFALPRNSKSLSMMPGMTVELQGLDNAARMETLAELPAGSILYMPGHIMLYLGQEDNRAFVLSATGGFVPENGYNQKRTFTVLINSLNVKNNAGVSWLQQLRCAKVITPVP